MQARCLISRPTSVVSGLYLSCRDVTTYLIPQHAGAMSDLASDLCRVWVVLQGVGADQVDIGHKVLGCLVPDGEGSGQGGWWGEDEGITK